MSKRTAGWLTVIMIVLLFLALCMFLINQQNRNILSTHSAEVNFSRADLRYLEEHDQIRIDVENELQYLIGDGEGGYLQEYMEEVLKPAGIRAEFVQEEGGKAEASLCVVTKKQRKNMEGRSYTAPLFQMEGSLFLRKGVDYGDPLQIVLMEDRLSEKKAEQLTWEKRRLKYTEKAAAAECVAEAQKSGADGILGDRSSLLAALEQAGLRNTFLLQEKDLYSCNVCVIVGDEEPEVYDILSECIDAADRHNISYDASERWLDGEGPVYLQQDYRGSYLPILIVLFSVLIAFFVYYITNRSMYQELNDRMDKITESRNELQTTFHRVGHYMAELSPGGEISEVNQAFAENVAAVALHRKIWEVLDISGEARKQIRRMVEDGARGIQDERYETRIGNKTFVIDIFPVEDARGEVSQLLFMAIDVTQERMAKRQMLQDNKMIAIGQLAAGVAHEIRNPLGIIRNYCYVLKTMEDEEVRKKAIEEIENAVEASGGIINNLLDFSRVSPGRMEEIDAEQHVRQILHLNESTFRSKNIEIVIDCPETIRTYIALEPFDMILLNLVKNATDAIEEAELSAAGTVGEAGAGRITVGLHEEQGSGTFTLSVADTGTGIEEEALEEIFNPFYTTKGNQGTGLGLYIVYSETEKLGGEIEVTSHKGEGTTFTVRLPIRHEMQATQEIYVTRET